MYRVDLEDGSVLEAYKHYWTRRYIHLDARGRAFFWLDRGLYEEGNPEELLAEVLRGHERRGNIVRHNNWVDGDRLSWARSATRHRISRKRSLWVIQHAGICMEQGVGSDGDPLLYFFGDDEDDRPLEVAGAESPTGRLTVIHSMQLREQFEEQYVEALRWRK